MSSIRELQELVEQGILAIGQIGTSEIRLMSKPVREALAAFVQLSEPVLEELVLARHAGAMEERQVADSIVLSNIVDDEDIILLGNLLRTERSPAMPGEPDYVGVDDVLGHAKPEDPDYSELGEVVMCPHTKDGVPCARTLHNVGLHTPEGYPENAAWTDKESDV